MAMTLSGTTGIVLPTAAAPAFSAYQSSAQGLSANTWTKIQFQTEEYDTNNNFDNATNYRFTPTVAGYYQINASGRGNNNVVWYTAIYKNGSAYKISPIASGASMLGAAVNYVVYLNGSTDYIEVYMYSSGSAQTLDATSPYTYFGAAMIRSA